MVFVGDSGYAGRAGAHPNPVDLPAEEAGLVGSSATADDPAGSLITAGTRLGRLPDGH